MTTREDTSGVSPVVAVILMVAVTVILSAVIGTFVLDIGQQTTDNSQSDIGLQTQTSSGQYTATVVTGTAKKLVVLVNGSEVANKTDVSPGDSITVSAPAGSTITVVEVGDGNQQVILSERVSTTSSASTVSAPTDGLIHHWTFDDSSTSTTAIDEAGSWNASINNSTDASFLSSFSGTAINLSGDAWVSTRETYVPTAGTVSFYVKPANIPDPENHLVGVGGTGEQLRTWEDSNNHTVALQVQNDSYTETIYTDTALKNDTWAHIVITWNYTTGQRSIYYNGTLQARATFDQQPPDDKYGWRLGRQTRDPSADSFYDGQFDDWRMYDRALNKTEVSRLYNGTK